MKNQEIADIFYRIANFLDMEDVSFRPYAYRRAANAIMELEESIENVFITSGRKGLEKIPGVGKNIAERIEEYLQTGRIKYYQELVKKMPVDIEELMKVEGVGPKTIKTLYRELGVRNIKDLEKAGKAHKIAPLFNFGEKTEKNILEGIAFLKKSKGRFLLGRILPPVREVCETLEKIPEVKKIEMAGSLRRRRETIGDADILIASNNPKKVMDSFVKMEGVIKVIGKGETKSSVKTNHGFNIDIRVVSPESFGSALQYFTGSKDHNITLRKLAISKKMKVNEYGVFKGERKIAGKTEKEVYSVLGLEWIPPEMREDRGEIELAKTKLPEIIGYDSIKGDLHCHTDWSGGENTIEEMAEMAISMGYQYIGISDHTKFLKIENGLDEKELALQRKEIDKLNVKFEKRKFKILHGCEANILKDGSIDIEDEALAKLDFVIAGVHSSMKMEKKEMTNRIIKAMRNPNVDIISHPTGRILQRREEYQIDFEKILKVAKETNTILEINASPERMDLNDINIARAHNAGVKMVINTDAHEKHQMRYIEYGIAQARRGWAKRSDIINTNSLNKIKFK